MAVNGTVVVSLIRGGERSPIVIGIVVSRADPASVAIGDQLRALGNFEPVGDADRDRTFELRTFEELHLELEDVADQFDDPDLVVFVSRHAGETGPLLTAHIPGNVGAAEYGGRPRTVPRAAPGALRTVYHALCDHVPDGYDVGLECTHHGPSRVGAPCLFVEVGSDETNWRDPEAARGVARAVLELEADTSDPDQVIVGFGGEHYVPRYERIVRETGWAVGHVAADWALAELADAEDRAATIDSLFTQSGAAIAHVNTDQDWVRPTIEELGYRVVSERWLREADGTDLAVVDRVVDLLGPIEEGTRIGDRGRVDPDDIEPCRLADQFVDLLNATDPERARSCLDRRTTGYSTVEGGSRVGPNIAVPPDVSWDALIDWFEPMIGDRFEEYEVTDGVIVGTTTRFDPAAARACGVPEGPAFGRLAAGDPVTVDGTTVDPAEVHVTDRVTVPIVNGSAADAGGPVGEY